MTNLKATVKEKAGYVEEEIGEAIGNDKMAQKGRDLRNEGKIENGKAPKLTPVGTTKD